MIPLNNDYYHLTLISKNKKTGPMAVSTSPKKTCPDNCPLKSDGCFADSGPIQLHWQQLSLGNRGVLFDDFLLQVGALRKGVEYRHNQAGDMPKKPGTTSTIDAPKLKQLTNVINKRKLKAFGYTHYPVIDNKENSDAIKYANDNGFAVNLSANNVSDVDTLLELNIAPVAVIMRANAKKVSYTEKGNKIVICPAQTNEKTACIDCMLCAKPDRKFSIGFYPHGTTAKKAAISTNNII